MEDVDLMAPDFQLYRYHGDERAYNPSLGKVIGKLKSSNEFFKGNCNPKIAFTTIQSLLMRNGPRAQANWRIEQLGWEKMVAESPACFFDQDTDFPWSLKGCFGTVVVDEAVMVKNPDSY